MLSLPSVKLSSVYFRRDVIDSFYCNISMNFRWHSNSSTPSDGWLTSDVLHANRISIQQTLMAQKRQRESRRHAFITWQTGQREKGAAHRLLRLARVTESNKRHHYHRQGGRLLPLTKE